MMATTIKITGTALEKHGNIHGKTATKMMRMIVNKMATHDNNYYNKEENDGTNSGTNNGNQEGKKACKFINKGKKQQQKCKSMIRTKWQQQLTNSTNSCS